MDSQLNMSANRARDFVTSSELADGSLALVDTYAASDAPSGVTHLEPAGAAVVGSSLLTFTEGVSRQSREDVMDSYLFATLVANKAFNPETQRDLWYAQFNQVLSTVGWLSTNFSYSRYTSTDQRFTMDQAGLEILGSAIAAAALPGPASAAMFRVAADAVKALSAKEEPLRVFESRTRSHRGANFQIGTCTESIEGLVNVAIGAVNFQAETEFSNVLFWEWNSVEVQTYRGADNLVLNSALYATVRELIRSRLGQNAESAIAEFEI